MESDHKRFPVDDNIFADTRVFQESVDKRRTQALHQFVAFRFPSLLDLVKQVIAQRYSAEQLQEIVKQLSCANTVEEARKALLHEE